MLARTRIELASGQNLGLSEDIAYSLTFAIADIREPDKRNAAFSKTISIPASKEADIFFKYAFEIDGHDNYNTNLKSKATIFIDDCQQVDGFLQLLRINITDNNLIFYEVNIKGNVTNVFQEWGDRMLSDLNLSAFDHTYNKTNQKASWTAPVGIGYVYPMIDYGQTNGLTYDVQNFFPAVYEKQYLDSAFLLIGKTYSSTFLNSTFFKRLCIPYNSTTLKLSASELLNRYFKANRTGDINHAGDGQIVQTNTDVSDVGNQFNTATYTFTASNTGDYTFRFDVTLAYTFSGIAVSETWNGKRVWVSVQKFDGTYFTVIGQADKYVEQATGYFTNPVTNATVTSNINIAGQTPSIRLNAGQQVILTILDVDLNPLSFSGTPQLVVKNGSFIEGSSVNSGLFDGNNLSMNNAIPQNIKIKDFFKWIVNRFNLYIETDKTNPNLLHIEPRDNFYLSGATKTWTSKLAIDKPIIVEPIGDLDTIEYQFSYKEDKDYWNKKYKDSYDEVYGTHRTIIENDFLKGVKKTEIGFSPTPLAQIGTTDRIISQIINLNSSGSISDIKACNIRSIYFAGVKTTAYGWSYTGLISGTTTETTYPYAGHVDNPLAPTLDLNFGVPKEVFYFTTLYTNNNLYNAYYKNYIDEISNPNSKIITCFLNLTPFDIQTLDFRDQFYIDKYYLRLNKIYDYNFVQNQLTKCEFVLVKKAIPFVADNTTIIGGSGVAFSDGSIAPGVLGSSISATTFGNVVAAGNVADSTIRGCIITGTGNYVGPGCENIILEGCTRCSIPAGISNVTLRNCIDLTITDSDLLYESNILQSADNDYITERITIPAASVAISNTTPYLLVSPIASVGFDVESVVRYIVYGTTPYATNLNMEVYTDTSAVSQFELTNGLISSVSSAIRMNRVVVNPAATDKQVIPNKGIYYRTKTGNPTAGNSVVMLVITYRKLS